MDVKKLCRVCLSESDELTPLWVKLPGESKTLEETINFVVNINIKLEDGFPDKICKMCESALDLADTIKMRCLKSESILEQQAQEIESVESQLICEKSHQENIVINSDDTSCLPISISQSSITDSLRKISENNENIYDLPEYKIKMEIEEHHVHAGVTISDQRNSDTAQELEAEQIKSNAPCLIKKEVSERSMDHSDSHEIYSCPHCNLTFRTKISYKVHILCMCEPNDLNIFKCALCDSTFTCKDSLEGHLRTHRSQKNSDTSGKLASNNDGDSSLDLFHAEELHRGEYTTDHALPSSAHQTDAPSLQKPKLDDMQPTTAKVRSATEDPAAADTSTTTISETESNFRKVKNTRRVKKKKNGKKSKLKQKRVKKIGKDIMKKESTKDTATMLKLSGTKTDDKITCATEKQSECSNNTVIGTTGDIPTCDICGYTTATVKWLNSHLKAHAATKRYSCDSCLYLTVNLKQFNRHTRTHTGERPYSCDVCDKKFIAETYLNSHLRIHTGEKPYSCKMCEKKFNQNKLLVYHSRTHTGEFPYSCDVCDRKFNVKHRLNIHLRIHTGEKPYSCNICGRKFKQSSHLVYHSRIHTGERPYSCDVCEKRFTQKSSLVKHVRTHTGESPYCCDVCEKRFTQKFSLVRHVRTHTNDKHYYCDICKGKFSKKGDLVRHIGTHTDDKPYACCMCEEQFSRKQYLIAHVSMHI